MLIGYAVKQAREPIYKIQYTNTNASSLYYINNAYILLL